MTIYQLRSTPHFASGKPIRIDRQKAVIYGVTAMQSGVEAIGHGCQADMKTLARMAEMGNTGHIRGRFGHPAMSENSTGRKVQVAKNFRVEDDRLVHDSHLLAAARKSPAFSHDPIEYILDMAENQPNEIGESVVISTGLVWTMKDGSEVECDNNGRVDRRKHPHVEADNNGRPINALTPLPVIRPVKFHYVDFVNEGALTHDGLFSVAIANEIFTGHSSEFASQLFGLVDEWRTTYKVPLSEIETKATHLVQKYISLRGKKPMEENESAAELEEKLARIEQRLLGADAGDNDGETAPVTTLNSLREENVDLRNRIGVLEAANARLLAMMVALGERYIELDAKITSVMGDPIVKMSVPKQPATQFGATLFAANPTMPVAVATPQQMQQERQPNTPLGRRLSRFTAEEVR